MTLSQPKTPKPIITKFERRHYVVEAYHQKNLGSIHPGFFAPHIGEIYTLPVRNLLHFFGNHNIVHKALVHYVMVVHKAQGTLFFFP